MTLTIVHLSMMITNSAENKGEDHFIDNLHETHPNVFNLYCSIFSLLTHQECKNFMKMDLSNKKTGDWMNEYFKKHNH